ncbi:uncharacterized protein K02A2.6-like [Galleria mellonella]|uniref:RNA-directed DNA polymerase n=1 Tax=Galleria mellonella TaxID=7137 RepID=A0ABM3MXH1_GALME|nr:uncharacterized protein K02A2.6-like [Galleria mellonella]
MSVEESKQVNLDIVREYEDVFSGIGCLPGKYTIRLKENSIPVVHAPRKLPFAIKDDVRKKLLEMESQGIIAKVEGPTDWVNSITIVRKGNGDLRICLDPKELNECIKREYFRLPTIDEILSQLSGACYFSTLDASMGFWQVELDETNKYCTFNTPFGRYKFLRMPFGICSASEVFHRKMYENFDDIEGVCMYIDDLLIYAKTKKEHDKVLRKVLNRCRKINLKLNMQKCKFGLQELKYLGHRITKNGLCADDSHISAIQNMPIPKNKKDIERFLGLVTYVGKFVPHLSDKTIFLRDILKKDVDWHWDENQERCFLELKNVLSCPPVLQYYSIKEPIVISVDASSSGLGACLMQKELPVCYASKALTTTEQRYAQIEKELYACVFACERFYEYIYGRSDVTIETDHKPLISIIKKPIVDSPARLQRMLLRLQRFTFRLIYKPGKHLYVADALSRAYEDNRIDESSLSDCDNFNDEICMVLCDKVLAISEYIPDLQLTAIQKRTQSDSELVQLKKYIMQGWPNDNSDVPEIIKPYWNYRNDLSYTLGLVFKNDRIVVPKEYRKEILNKIHIGHLGLEKCKLRAREIVFWPGMNNDLHNLITNCNTCLSHRKSNQKQELIPHSIPDRAWEKVGVDLFQLKGEDYLLLVDYFSKFCEVVKLHSTMSESVINALKNIFYRQGIPNIVMSDCGPQFSSSLFRQFALDWGFIHTTSSPYYPQSNGQVERMVQTIKNIMIKTNEDQIDYRLAILEYLNTPLTDSLPSPAELLQSRKLKSIIPTSNKLLKSKVHTNVRNKLIERQALHKYYYDRNKKHLESLSIGQKVKVYNKFAKRWTSGIVTGILRDRSYEILLSNGNKVVRNRRHIIRDSSQRHDPPQDYNFEYDDNCQYCDNTNNLSSDTYSSDIRRTRYGRVVRPPDRWGYENES